MAFLSGSFPHTEATKLRGHLRSQVQLGNEGKEHLPMVALVEDMKAAPLQVTAGADRRNYCRPQVRRLSPWGKNPFGVTRADFSDSL
jgi:hypothetical protein